ncbi:MULTISPECIES: A/G-specific adenine glycosylase [Alphaproteobacteria]|uniref:A/G-specific adenine glycosylase n=1 Tax=Alphaproteobacteria TaxID=28211 RepID=UPI00273027D0|nr:MULTISPECIES: A/G-specific adenine glycosylase [Alphaproteobacteria]MDP1626761.1 A/G-specific adenine glycosylase [Parvibaculum sp.]MDP2213811.1 A/G-specific adenine glycosylase [Phenylobacterium sp.]MDP3329776.1 A/G-specific adenine glycosylase [Parvibaculum sp.]
MSTKAKKAKEISGKAAAAPLLAWYDKHARVLPWRAQKGERADPYVVWLSEIMLQQTTVATVGPYFKGFLKRWPNVEALAGAPQEEVMKAWAGLGYYSRARNLHACAKAVSSVHGGKFPDTVEGLERLPGIGPYTAAAIAAIAFGRAATVVDGNVERVVARLFEIETPLPAAKPEIREKARTLTPEARTGDFAQAMMDLGATVCTPRSPACNRCPINDLCDARAAGTQDLLPARAPKKPRPTRRGACFWLMLDGHVWLRRRPDKGLLGGMLEVPGTPWDERDCHRTVIDLSQGENRAPRGVAGEVLDHAPMAAEWRLVPGLVEHTFTHFHLELEVFTATTRKKLIPGREGMWVPLEEVAGEALPTVMRKVAAHAMPEAGPLFVKR